MAEPPDKPSKPRKRRVPPIRIERFTGEWSDLVWLKEVKPLAPETGVQAPKDPPKDDNS